MRVIARAMIVLSLAIGLAPWGRAARLPGVLADLATPQFGKLTQFWAHQAIGIPEGHAFIRELAQNNFSFTTPQLGVLDVGFSLDSILADVKLTPQLHEYLSASATDTDDMATLAHVLPTPLRDFLLPRYARHDFIYRKLRHGSAIAHLLTGKTDAGVSLNGAIAMLLPFPRWSTVDDKKQLRELIATLTLPDVINYSLRFSNDDYWSVSIAPSVQAIAAKTILVMSAGNRAPEPIEAGKQELASQAIIVGSTDPTGHVSAFSQTGAAETIRACSDSYLQSVSPKSGEFFNFSGTSGAAPMVSAALADVLSILPNLTRQHAGLLLQNTALPNTYGDEIGLLNYYKLLRVAHRLAERGWSATTGKEAMLHDASLYDFRAEAEQLTQAALAAPEFAVAFSKLRQAFFLDPDNSSTRAQLAAIYRQHGYEAQAFFYDNPNADAREAFIVQKKRAHQDAVDKFLLAVANADTQRMQELLPEIRIKYLLKQKIITLAASLRALSHKQQVRVVNFLQQHRVAVVTITADGEEVRVLPLLD